jgi:hypothetical protein
MSYDPGAPGDRSQPPGGYGGQGGPPPYGSGYGQQPPPGAWGPPPGPPQGGPAGYGGGGQFQAQGKSFFTGLVDFKFQTFFTSAMLPIVYALGVVYLVVEMISTVYNTFQVDAGYGILALVVGLISVVFFAGLLKVGLELVKAIVEGAEQNRR